jgi:pimeloyl-ACP methyl ester carboxylesterase
MSPHAEKSTNGRAKIEAPPALRAGFGVLQAVAPPLAERVAYRLFMTPPRHRAPGRELAALAGAEPFTLRAAGTTVRGRRLGHGPAVLLLHGWGGRSGQLANFAVPLVEAGCTVVAFDGPAHGASGGRTTNLVRMAEAAAAVARRFEARAAIGHSFGGAALAYAIHRGLTLDAAVLVAPPRTPRSFLDLFCDALGLRSRTREGLRRHIERRVGVPWEELDIPFLARTFRTPALVVHDRADGEVPFEDGAAIASAWPGARLLPTEGLGHRRILRDGAVVAGAASFVLDRMERCGCGRLAVATEQGAPRCETCLLEVHRAYREERTPRSGFDASVAAILRSMERGVDPARVR